MQRSGGLFNLSLRHNDGDTALGRPLRDHLDVDILLGDRVATSSHQARVIPEALQSQRDFFQGIDKYLFFGVGLWIFGSI